MFTPLNISKGVEEAFEENALKINQSNPYDIVKPFLKDVFKIFKNLPIRIEKLPEIKNPFKEIELSPRDTSYLPPSGTPIVGPNSNLNTTQTTQQKGQQIFGPNDPVFGG